MLRKLAAGTSAALVAAGLAAAPAVAAKLPTPRDDACGETTGQQGLDKITTPPDGSTVAPGDTIDVTLRWDERLFDSKVLERALDCVQIDGQPVAGLGLDQRQAPNQGQVTHRYRLPAGLPAGSKVCDQGFVFGPPADVPQRLASNRVCFTVAAPPTTTQPPAAPSPAPAGPAAGPSAPCPDGAASGDRDHAASRRKRGESCGGGSGGEVPSGGRPVPGGPPPGGSGPPAAPPSGAAPAPPVAAEI
jgi:hypothetical protein